MTTADATLCHRCGYTRPAGEDRTQCPQDGLRLVPEAEHRKSPRDMFLGTTVGGRYPILGIVGQGGMGAVYRSVQPLVEREVAIKLVLPGQEAAGDVAAQRFLREAKAVAALNHSASDTLYDFGVEDDGTADLVRERVRGAARSRALRDDRVSPERTVEICLEVLEALQVAHRQGLIHRDLKPENIMMLDDASGRHTLKVLDFGLAKLAGSGSAGPQLTKTGAVFGTPQYMAPEQALGEEADARTDLYALGVILHQGLTGALPFDSDNVLSLLQAHVAEPLPDLPAEVPPGLAAVVRKALAKERDERFADAAAMAEALSAARDAAARRTLQGGLGNSGGVEPTMGPEAAGGALAHALTEADISGDQPTALSAPRPAAPRPPGWERTQVDARLPPPAPGEGEGPPSQPSLLSLGDAAGEVAAGGLLTMPADAPARRWVARAGVAAAAVLGVGLAMAFMPDDPPPTRAADTPTTGLPAPVADPPPAPEAPAPAPPETRVHVESQPSGAHVWLGDTQIGSTPLTLTPEGAMGDRIVYRLKAKGRKAQSLEIDLDGRERTRRVVLARKGRRKAAAAKEPKEAPAARPRPEPRPTPRATPTPTPTPTLRPAALRPQPRAAPAAAQPARKKADRKKKLALPRRRLK